MACRIHIGLFTVMMVAANASAAMAQLLPQVTPKPAKAPATQPAQIVVETSPNAEVYLDDQYTGRASSEGRLVIGNPKPGERGWQRHRILYRRPLRGQNRSRIGRGHRDVACVRWAQT